MAQETIVFPYYFLKIFDMFGMTLTYGEVQQLAGRLALRNAKAEDSG